MPDKCLLIVLDGLGDRSHEVLDWRTPLQASYTPHLDRLARNGANGLYHAGTLGEALPSETAHFAIFGYDRKEFPGRGPLEALGAGVDLSRDEVAILAHFAALEERDGCLALVRDVPQVEEEEVAALIRAVDMWEQDGIRVRYVPVKGVFGVLVLSGDVSPDITDTGPMRDGRFLSDVLPLVSKHARRAGPDGPDGTDGAESDEVRARRTANVLRAYLLHVWRTLREHPLNARRRGAGLPPVTGLVTQRAGRLCPVQPFSRRFGLRGLSIASGAVFRGLARYLGMDWQAPRDTGNLQADFAHDLAAVPGLFDRYDFIHLHTKAPDEAAHAKDPLLKKSVIEALDQALGNVEDSLLKDPDLLVVVTADHSTPSSGNMIHSGEPVPLLFHGNGVRRDMVDRFDEIHAASGCLGGVRGRELLRLALNHLDMARLEGIRDTPDECLYWPGDYQPLPVR
ncbi:alkaline phosphatase family protein [Desulfonatronum sp. SC1]|uniref:alkaline phosphatase family protein n=1 Tax=Desulfonatronum sp. SC1 TaxID=2109626 RepID=UPI000D30822E|nr:alkaline phosphatase family protein [Desulfonatronum sp. SC1]PTN37499.1 phosphoglycerate mutase [Desulfonatronum sp. SC1]